MRWILKKMTKTRLSNYIDALPFLSHSLPFPMAPSNTSQTLHSLISFVQTTLAHMTTVCPKAGGNFRYKFGLW